MDLLAYAHNADAMKLLVLSGMLLFISLFIEDMAHGR